MNMGVQSKFYFPSTILGRHNSAINMIMVDRNDLLYILGASALGAASIAYILFGDSISPSTKNSNVIRGLKNVKNNCFINSILQAFSSSDSMVVWLNLAKHQQQQNVQPTLIYQLSLIVNAINTKCDSNQENISPEGVLNSLRKHRWVFTNDEQDAFELFCVLTNTLDIESNRLSLMLAVRDVLSEQVTINGFKSKSNATNKFKFLTRTSGFMDISSQFKNTLPTRGILSNHLTCQNCHSNYPIHLDIFDAVSLSLPAIDLGTSIPLEDCLKKFVAAEEIEDFSCQYCKTKCTFSKRIGFAKLPQLLCLHLHRLVWINGNRPFKRMDHVKFPEYLVMDPFKHGKSERSSNNLANSVAGHPEKTLEEHYYHRYALSSVIVHLGNDNSGHFVCYRSKPDRGTGKIKWYYTSDLVVKEVPKKQVFSTSAYMLFYEKITRINVTL